MSNIGAEGRKARGDGDPPGVEPTGVVDTPSPAEAKEKVMAKAGPLNDKYGANGVKPKHAWDLDYTDQRGYRWQGHFKCHVLKYKEKMQVGLIRANMSQGVAPNLLDIGTYNLIEMLSHLAVALDDMPDWARGKGLEDLYDARVVFAIFEEVDKHESRFHGSEPPDSGKSDGETPKDPDGESTPPEDWKPSEAV